MTIAQKIGANAAIHTASVAAAGVGAGLAQIPAGDCIPLVGIQTGMIIAIGKVFGKELDESAGKAAAVSGMATALGKAIAKVAAGKVVITWIPIVGNVTNAAIAFTLTEMIGWESAIRFDQECRGRRS